LSLALENDIKEANVPVILTASSLPAEMKGSDAFPNFSRACRVAQDPNLPAHVYFIFGNTLSLASQITKVIGSTPKNTVAQQRHARFDDFDVHGKPVGNFGADGKFKMEPWNTGFQVNAPRADQISFAQVEHLLIDENTPIDVLNDCARRLRRLAR